MEKDSKINTPIQNMINETQKDGTVGPLIGSIIVILLFVVGGLYYFGNLISIKKTEIETQKVAEEIDETNKVESAAKQDKTDDVESIEKDIKSTDIDSIGSDLNNIEKEFKSK